MAGTLDYRESGWPKGAKWWMVRGESAAADVNETNAVLASRYFDLLKVVEAYEKNGVTCQTFRHFIDTPCAECNSTPATEGVAAIQTKGKADHPVPARDEARAKLKVKL